jgi:hypothetical protein
MSSEELKKEWEDKLITTLPECDVKVIDNYYSSLLAKQQEAPMGYSQWLEYGKKFGYHDYWKDMTRIAVEEEFVKIIKTRQKENEVNLYHDSDGKILIRRPVNITDESILLAQEVDAVYDELLADIKSKLNK